MLSHEHMAELRLTTKLLMGRARIAMPATDVCLPAVFPVTCSCKLDCRVLQALSDLTSPSSSRAYVESTEGHGWR